jgi:hypothetical protein
MTEIEIMCGFRHPHVAHGRGWVTEGVIGVATPRAVSDLGAWWGRVGFQGPGVGEDVARHITSAVVYLHGNRIVHLDIKPENILVYVHPGCRPTFKLTDFGSAMVIPEGETLVYTQPVVTSWWRPPEIWLAEEGVTTFGFEVDVWALGMVVRSALTGRPPLYVEYLEAGGSPSSPLAYVEFLEATREMGGWGRMLEINPAFRPSLVSPRSTKKALRRSTREVPPDVNAFISKFADVDREVGALSIDIYLACGVGGGGRLAAAVLDIVFMARRGVDVTSAILSEAYEFFGNVWHRKDHERIVDEVLKATSFAPTRVRRS